MTKTEEPEKNLGSQKKERRNKKYIELRTKGKSNVEASKAVGFSKSAGHRLWTRYEAKGEDACTPQYQSPERKLSPEKEKTLWNKIRDTAPDKNGLEYFLWSKEAVRSLIEKESKIVFSLSFVSKYLNGMNIFAPSPDRTILSENKNIARWLNSINEEEDNLTNKESYEIHWCFEKISIDNEEKINMISSVSNQGKFRFLLYKGEIDKSKYEKFRKRILRECGKNLCIILHSNSKHKYIDYDYKVNNRKTLRAKLFKIDV